MLPPALLPTDVVAVAPPPRQHFLHSVLPLGVAIDRPPPPLHNALWQRTVDDDADAVVVDCSDSTTWSPHCCSGDDAAHGVSNDVRARAIPIRSLTNSPPSPTTLDRHACSGGGGGGAIAIGPRPHM